jgi:hypothetical protein
VTYSSHNLRDELPVVGGTGRVLPVHGGVAGDARVGAVLDRGAVGTRLEESNVPSKCRLQGCLRHYQPELAC